MKQSGDIQGQRGRGAFRLFATSLAVSGAAFALIVACGSDGVDPAGGAGATSGPTDVPSECGNYCTAQAKLACASSTPHDQCVASCEHLVASFGPCAEEWRAEMRCLTAGHLACVNGMLQGTACLAEYSALSMCAAAHPDAGIGSPGEGQ